MTEFELIVIDKMISYLLIVTIIAAPFLVINFYRYEKDYSDRKQSGEYVSYVSWFTGLPYKSILAFIVPIIVTFILSSLMISTVRSNILDFLLSATPATTIIVEDNVVSNTSIVLSELQKIETHVERHSHPEKDIHITIKNKGNTLELRLGRDSGRPSKYWVFYPHYKHTSMNAIGKITTSLFDSYK